jgi:hypothetical protein
VHIDVYCTASDVESSNSSSGLQNSISRSTDKPLPAANLLYESKNVLMKTEQVLDRNMLPRTMLSRKYKALG